MYFVIYSLRIMKQGAKIIFTLIITAAITAVICCLLLYRENIWLEDQLPQEKVTTVKEKDYVQLLFVGDVMLDRGIRYYANIGGSNNFIFAKISQTLMANDLVVANLEGPITENKSISMGTIAGSTNNYYFHLILVGQKLYLITILE